jgi:hypothetical protein
MRIEWGKFVLFFCLLLLLFVFQTKTTHEVTAQAIAPKLIGWNGSVLVANKVKFQQGDANVKSAYAHLMKQADQLLKEKPVSVMEKKQLAPSGNRRDYLSYAPYSWPSGVRDGQVNPESKEVPDQENFKKMVNAVRILSLAYYFSGNEVYSNQSAVWLRTWFINYNTKMNPNLHFAQLIKGDSGVHGAGVIDFNMINVVVDSTALISNSKSWSAGDKQAMQVWFSDYLKWLQYSDKGKIASKFNSNHGSWYDVQVVSVALFVGRKDVADKVLNEVKTKRIGKQIEADGRMPEELKRTKSWDYSIFNLCALFSLAEMAEGENIDLWNYSTSDGRSLKKALEYMLPVVDGKSWDHQQIDKFNPAGMYSLLRRSNRKYSDKGYWGLADKNDKNAKISLDQLLYTK